MEDLYEFEEGYKLIGEDCISIINDYVEQLNLTERYDKVMKELKIKVYYHMISDRFSLLCFNGMNYHYYNGMDGYLMMIRYLDDGYSLDSYLHNRNMEIVYLFV